MRTWGGGGRCLPTGEVEQTPSPRIRKAGSTHPTGMLSCSIILTCRGARPPDSSCQFNNKNTMWPVGLKSPGPMLLCFVFFTRCCSQIRVVKIKGYYPSSIDRSKGMGKFTILYFNHNKKIKKLVCASKICCEQQNLHETKFCTTVDHRLVL